MHCLSKKDISGHDDQDVFGHNDILWTFQVTMTVSGQIDISVSLTTQSHLRKKISLQLEQKTAQVSA